MSDRPVLVACPGCATDLRVPPAAVGTTIPCPVCRRPVPVPRDTPPADPPPADPPPAPPANAPPADAPAADAPVAPPTPAPEARRGRKPIPLSVGVAVAVAGACGLGLYLAQRPAVPGEIPEARWQTVEVPGRVRAKLPGPARAETTRDPATGLTLTVHACSPDGDSVYGVGYSEEVFPPDVLRGKADQLLDALAAGLTPDAGRGGAEPERTKLGGPRPGRQVVLRLPGKEGTMVQRVYLVRGRVYVLMAAGPDLGPDHPNVLRLFRSFEPLDAGAAPPADEP